MNNFDTIAPYYDRLAKLVFGPALQKSQSIHIPLIPVHSKVLILGGGTGRSAWEISQVTPDVEIVYVEKSEKMLNIARERFELADQLKITFVNASYEEYKTSLKFDVIVAQCFFDVFTKAQLRNAALSTHDWLDEKGVLLVTDFQIIQNTNAKFWQRPFALIMHAFFRLCAQIEGTRLEDIDAAILEAGFNPIREEYFYGQLIFSRVYAKAAHRTSKGATPID